MPSFSKLAMLMVRNELAHTVTHAKWPKGKQPKQCTGKIKEIEVQLKVYDILDALGVRRVELHPTLANTYPCIGRQKQAPQNHLPRVAR